jgi:hypothetical protein
MNLQTTILAELLRRERDREEVPERQERRRITRLAETIAACCRTLTFARLRARLRRDRDPSCARAWPVYPPTCPHRSHPCPT